MITREIRSTRRARAGFTLLEILMVVAIIVILAGLATMYLIPALNQSQSDLARVKARSLETPATTYKLRNGSFPNDLAILAQPDPKYQNNAYVEESAILDPWGNKYMIEFPGAINKGGKPDIYTTDPNTGEKIGNWGK